MLFHEEETVSSVIEQGTFYTPATQTEIDENAPLFRAIWKIVPGILLATVLPYVLPQLSLIPFLAGLFLLAGLLPMMQEHKSFQLGALLAGIGLVLSAWGYICGNILQSDPLPGILSKALSYGAIAVNLCLFGCLYVGIRQVYAPGAMLTGLSSLAFLVLTLLGLLGGGTVLLIGKICAALVCTAALVITAININH